MAQLFHVKHFCFRLVNVSRETIVPFDHYLKNLFLDKIPLQNYNFRMCARRSLEKNFINERKAIGIKKIGGKDK